MSLAVSFATRSEKGAKRVEGASGRGGRARNRCARPIARRTNGHDSTSKKSRTRAGGDEIHD